MTEHMVLLVRLATDLYAIPIAAIEEVLPALPIEQVPQAPAFVRGVIFVRGHVIPVLDAARRLAAAGHAPEDDPAIVCLRQDNRLIGVLFDEAIDLLDLAEAATLPTSDLGVQDGICTGMVERGGRLIRLLDPAKLASLDETVGSR